MGRVKKANPDAEAFERIVASFKTDHPGTWEELRLCPLQSGIEEMAKKLKG